jgi:hypothetical protein
MKTHKFKGRKGFFRIGRQPSALCLNLGDEMGRERGPVRFLEVYITLVVGLRAKESQIESVHSQLYSTLGNISPASRESVGILVSPTVTFHRWAMPSESRLPVQMREPIKATER